MNSRAAADLFARNSSSFLRLRVYCVSIYKCVFVHERVMLLQVCDGRVLGCLLEAFQKRLRFHKSKSIGCRVNSRAAADLPVRSRSSLSVLCLLRVCLRV